VANGGALAGNGTINDNVTVVSNSIASGTIDALTVNGNFTIAGNLAVDVNRAGLVSDHPIVSGTVSAVAGAVTVNKLGAALQVGDTFTLFSGPVSGGGALTISGGRRDLEQQPCGQWHHQCGQHHSDDPHQHHGRAERQCAGGQLAGIAPRLGPADADERIDGRHLHQLGGCARHWLGDEHQYSGQRNQSDGVLPVAASVSPEPNLYGSKEAGLRAGFLIFTRTGNSQFSRIAR
jgi:hypothetical protein